MLKLFRKKSLSYQVLDATFKKILGSLPIIQSYSIYEDVGSITIEVIYTK